MNRHLSLRSGNPVLSKKTFTNTISADNQMTIEGTVNKTAISLLLLIGTGYFTFDVINRGYNNYSINSVFERIRWHTDIETKCEREFKLSNNHRAYYARYFMHLHPKHDGFFRTKETKS